MQHAERLTLTEMREFLDASSNLSFAGAGRKQIYALVEGALRAQKYMELSKKDKGIVRRYLVKVSGLSKAQITRLIARWREQGVIEPRASRRHRFPHRYTPSDIKLLAKTDGAHEGLSAAVVRRILEREFKVHRQAEYERDDFYFLHKNGKTIARRQPGVTPQEIPALMKYDKEQIRELMTQYGKVGMMFLDGPPEGLSQTCWAIDPARHGPCTDPHRSLTHSC